MCHREFYFVVKRDWRTRYVLCHSDGNCDPDVDGKLKFTGHTASFFFFFWFDVEKAKLCEADRAAWLDRSCKKWLCVTENFGLRPMQIRARRTSCDIQMRVQTQMSVKNLNSNETLHFFVFFNFWFKMTHYFRPVSSWNAETPIRS